MNFRIIITLLFSLTIIFHAQAQWQMGALPDGRAEISSVAIDDNIYFVGGATSGIQRYFKMNIYNVPTETWTTVDVPNGTKGPRTIAIDKKIYFGDIEGDKTIYVYDTEIETWDEISVPGFIGTMIHMDNMILIEDAGDLMIYDLNTGEWTEFDFETNFDATIAATNGKVVIAGGSPNLVRIYDVATDSWTESELSIERDEPRAVSHGNRMFFIGGEADGFSWTGRIDIYDTEENTWSLDSLSLDRNRFDVTIHNDKMIVAGGQIISFSNQFRTEVDIFDLNTNIWETIHMPTGRNHPSVIGHNDKIYIAGGDGEDEDNLNVIEIYTLTPTSTEELSKQDIRLFPNPVLEKLSIETEQNIKHFELMDVYGRIIEISPDQFGNIYNLNVSNLNAGIYFLRINKQHGHLKFIKM
jgi:Uncharacterized protein conserved in bacteria